MDFDMLQREVMRAHREGRYDDAVELIDAWASDLRLDAATLAWWRTCLLARAGHTDRALLELRTAINSGHWYAAARWADEDLDAIRDDPAFGDLAATSAQREADVRDAPPADLAVHHRLHGRDDRGLVIALHHAASSPSRSARHWEPATAAGWTVALPTAPHALGSEDHLWLDLAAGRLDLDGAVRAVREPLERDELTPRPLVLAGFAQGAAVAAHLALSGAIDADGLLVVGATDRYREILDATDGAGVRRALVIAGADERHTDAAEELAAALDERGVQVVADIRPGLGHAFPPDFAEELPRLLDDVTAEA